MKRFFLIPFILLTQIGFGQTDAGINSIFKPTGNICAGSTIPIVILENFGSTTLTTVDILYNVDGAPNSTYVWNGNLGIGTTVNIPLPSISPLVGAHVFNAITASPNGTIDSNISNDANSSNFTVIPPISYTAIVTNTNCGTTDGSIVITASGGMGALQYSIDNGTTFQASNSFSSLGIGTYNIVIEDANGCQELGIETILTNGGPSIIVATGTDPSCYGTDDGTIVIAAAPPTTGFTYSADGGISYSTLAFFQNLSPGTYTVFVKDSTGCQTFQNVTLFEPAQINTIIFGNNAACTSSNGSASVIASGGDGNFSYSWNDPANQTSSTASNLLAGFYHVTVTDGGGTGCSVSDSVFIGNNGGPSVSLINTNVLCYGYLTGEISTSVGGGTAPYTYLWNDANNQTTGTATGLGIGTYLVEVTDNNGCKVFGSETISEPELLTGILVAIQTTCGNSNGIITANVNGGILPYSYLWNDLNNQINSTAVNLAAGQYIVEVTDDNGCPFTEMTDILPSDSVLISYQVIDASCTDIPDGSIEIFVSGGISPYSILWSSGESSDTLVNLSSGIYTVKITDSTGCTINPTIPVSAESSACLVIPTAFSPNMDGKNDFWVIEGIDITEENQVEIYNRWGALLYQNSAYQNDWNGTFNGGNLPVGGYFYFVTISDKTYSGPLAIIR